MREPVTVTASSFFACVSFALLSFVLADCAVAQSGSNAAITTQAFEMDPVNGFEDLARRTSVVSLCLLSRLGAEESDQICSKRDADVPSPGVTRTHPRRTQRLLAGYAVSPSLGTETLT